MEERTQHLSIDDAAALFTMTRGVQDVLLPAWGWIAEDPIIVMFGVPKHTRKHDSSTEACRFAMFELELIYRDVIFMPAQDACKYNEDYYKRKDLELGVLMKWTTVVSNTFVALIRAKNTAALVLLAHWMVLFKRMGDRWF